MKQIKLHGCDVFAVVVRFHCIDLGAIAFRIGQCLKDAGGRKQRVLAKDPKVKKRAVKTKKKKAVKTEL